METFKEHLHHGRVGDAMELLASNSELEEQARASPLFAGLQWDILNLQSALEALDPKCSGEWVDFGISEGIRVQYRHIASSPFHSVFLETDVEAPFTSILACIIEVFLACFPKLGYVFLASVIYSVSGFQIAPGRRVSVWLGTAHSSHITEHPFPGR